MSEHQLDCPGELLAKARGETLFKDENTTVRRALQLPQRELGPSAPVSPGLPVLQAPPANAGEIRGSGLTSRSGQEDPLEEGMAIHSSILAWRIQWIGNEKAVHLPVF